MNLLNISHAATTTSQAPNPLVNMLPLVAVVVFFYFFMIRPQQKKYKELNAMLNALKVGDKIATSSGIIGEVIHIDADSKTCTIKTSKHTEITIYKQSVSSILNIEDKNVTGGSSVGHNK